MSNVLEELYFGNINPNEKQFVQNSDYDKAIQIIAANEDRLTESLAGKEKSLFFDYANAQSEVTGIIAVENFIDGFRLGAKIILEVMSDTIGSLRNI